MSDRDSKMSKEEPEEQSAPSEAFNPEIPRPGDTVSLKEDVSLFREVLTVAVICVAQISTQAGLNQMLSILTIVGDHFDVSGPTLSWFIAGYSLTVGTFILFSGRIGDLFGWKRMLVIGYVWFAVWTLVAGLSWYSNHVLFIFARVLQGIGPAITMPNGLALLGALYKSGPRKNMAFAVFGACAPGGAMIGATFAALFALAWWPWAFFSFSIALFGIAIVAAIVVPDPQDFKPGFKGKSWKDSLAALDFWGAALGITGLILFNFAWNQAPIVGWDNAYIIVTLILGVIMVPAFIWYELHIATDPLLPWDIFTANNAFVLACVACGWGNFGVWFYYLWSILENIRGTSPLLACAYISPVAVSGAFAAITTGYLLGRVHPSWLMVASMSAFIIGTTLVATFPPHQVYWAQIFVCCVVGTFGMDMSFPSATLVISDSVEKEHQGVAASLVNTVVNYSISIGLGFAGTVEVNVNHGGITKHDLLLGYRGALYFGVGLGGLGLVTALLFVVKTYWRHEQKPPQVDEGSGSAASDEKVGEV